MRIALNPRRFIAGLILQCIMVTIVVIIGGFLIYIILHLCDSLPNPNKPPKGTNDTMTASIQIPAFPGPHDTNFSYLMVLQQREGTDWVDVASTVWDGTPTGVSFLTNNPNIGIYRVKAVNLRVP